MPRPQRPDQGIIAAFRARAQLAGVMSVVGEIDRGVVPRQVVAYLSGTVEMVTVFFSWRDPAERRRIAEAVGEMGRAVRADAVCHTADSYVRALDPAVVGLIGSLRDDPEAHEAVVSQLVWRNGDEVGSRCGQWPYERGGITIRWGDPGDTVAGGAVTDALVEALSLAGDATPIVADEVRWAARSFGPSVLVSGGATVAALLG